MKQLILILAALLVASAASAEGVRRPGGGGSGSFILQGAISDASTANTTVSDQIHSPCGDDNTTPATIQNGYVCHVPVGKTWTIKKVAYYVNNDLSVNELCNIALTTDLTVDGSTPTALSFETWSDTDMGAGTTPTCNGNTVTGALDTTGEYCINTDATGLVATAGTPILVRIAEVSAADCDLLQDVSYFIYVNETP